MRHRLQERRRQGVHCLGLANDNYWHVDVPEQPETVKL